MTHILKIALAAALGLSAAACQQSKASADAPKATRVSAASTVEAGRYLTTVGGCNDCHTAGWNETGGGVPDARRLTGTDVGWQGPWGTTYPSNLRLTAASMTEDEWVAMLRTRKDRPPMPWMNLNAMHEQDARAIYAYLKSLGPAGKAMPPALPPRVAPKTAFIPLAPPAAAD